MKRYLTRSMGATRVLLHMPAIPPETKLFSILYLVVDSLDSEMPVIIILNDYQNKSNLPHLLLSQSQQQNISLFFYPFLHYISNFFVVFFFLSIFLHPVLFLFLLLGLPILWAQPKTQAVHSHNYSHVLDVMQFDNVLLSKPRQYLVNSLFQNLNALLVRIRNHEAVDMNQWHFVCPHAECVIIQLAQEFYGIHWQVHVEMVGSFKYLFIRIMLFVHFLYGLTSAHVPALYPVLYAIDLAILHEVLIATWVKIIRNHVGTFFGCSHCQGTHPTENVSQKLLLLDEVKDSIPLFLQSRAPIDPLKIKLEADSHFFHFNLVVFFTCHVLEDWSAVNIVQFLCLIYCCFDVAALGQRNLADYFFEFVLLWSQIIMGDMTSSLKTIGERNRFLSFFDLLEPIKYFLIREVVKVEFDFAFDN